MQKSTCTGITKGKLNGEQVRGHTADSKVSVRIQASRCAMRKNDAHSWNATGREWSPQRRKKR